MFTVNKMAPQYDVHVLPLELVAKVLEFLPGYEIAKVARTSKYFHQATHIDTIWQKRCQLEYHIPPYREAPCGSYFNLYSRVLHPYGFMLGTWRSELKHYGGFLHGMCSKDGSIVLNEFHGIGKVTDPLYCTQLCEIQYSEEDERVRCVCGTVAPHKCSVEKISAQEMRFTCEDESKDHHHEDLDSLFEHMAKHLRPGFEFSILLGRRKLAVKKEYNKGAIGMTRFELAGWLAGVPIQPGLFTGTYGAHGIEILHLTYNADLSRADVVKITGDPNVPAGKVSVSVDLRRPMLLTAEQQTSLDFLAQIDTAHLPPNTDLSRLPRQPYVHHALHADLGDNDHALPSHCTARFHSKGLIAGENHHNPCHIKGHWVVFDEETFAHIWFELQTVGIFKRVKKFPSTTS